MSLSVNDELLADRYELAEVVGIGGMAEVYRAWDTVLRRPVAVKLFTPTADLGDVRRFDNEVRVLAGLSHPGLVAVYDIGTAGRTPFVVLQLIDGRTLRHLIDDGPLPVDDVRRSGAALADALAYVHDEGVVHRDVKPSNILLDNSDKPYLADFGLAHLAGATRLTRTGVMVGTAAYLAPEQVRGDTVGSAADIYALGLVLLECVTGVCEYTGSDIEVAVARLHRSPTIPADLPVDLARLLSLMTSQEPHQRPTAHQCAHALRTGELPGITTPPDSREPAPTHAVAPQARRVPRKTLVASAAGLLGALGIAWAMSSGTAPAPSESPAPARQAIVESTTSATAPATTTASVLQQTIDTAVQPDTTHEQNPTHEQAAEQGQATNQEVEQDHPTEQDTKEKKDKPVPPGQAKKNKP